MQYRYDLTWQILAACGLVLGAGVLHFVYAPTHLAEARGQGIFFLILGFIQIGWGAAVVANPTPRTYMVGLVAATTMPAVLYVAARLMAAPFSDEAEGIDAIGGTSFLAESLGAILVAWHGLRQSIQWRGPSIPSFPFVALLVVGGIALAGAFWGTGLALGGVDWLADPESEGHHAAAIEETGHHATVEQTPAVDVGGPDVNLVGVGLPFRGLVVP